MAIEYVPYDGPVVTRARALASGAKWYFSGKSCKHGHLSLRRTSTKMCQGCQAVSLSKLRDATAKQRQAAPLTPRQIAAREGRSRYFTGIACDAGHVAERFTGSRGCCECSAERRCIVPPERQAAYSARWREAHTERWQEVLTRYRARHRIRRNSEARDRYATDPANGRARTKRWRERNPEGVRAHAMTRLALKKGSSGSYTATDVQELYAAQKGKCPNCRISLKRGYHVDHVEPLARGGLNVRSNLQILCPPCNLSKHASDPIEWAQRNGRLL